jgi:hypothetical protein
MFREPNKLSQVVMFLTCIREVPGSNLGNDTDNLDEGSRGFTQSITAHSGISNVNYATSASFHILSNSLFTIVQSSDVTHSELRAASSYKLETNKQTKKQTNKQTNLLREYQGRVDSQEPK